MNTFTAPPALSRKPAKDPVLAGAVDLARAAAEEDAGPGQVGEHLGFVLEGERLGSHYFASTSPGYLGWRWSVTVARATRSRTATVCEIGLLPGDGAILAKEWLPWSHRLAPGDVGPTDRLPYVADDDHLEHGYVATGDPETDRVAIIELGLDRHRVMNHKALDAAATRWYAGSQGPNSAAAKAAEANCADCGFIVLLAGSLGTVFGVCANEWSPEDGKIVSLDHGCGAHSETDVIAQPHEWLQTEPYINELDLEVVESNAEPAAHAVDYLESESQAEDAEQGAEQGTDESGADTDTDPDPDTEAQADDPQATEAQPDGTEGASDRS